jgi:pyruvate formate lyase activating enzyme
MKGLIFDIKQFALHDGQGIRTTVFLKGCPLDCLWCQNPEGKQPMRRLWYFQNRCLECGNCIAVCPEQALAAAADTGRSFSSDREPFVQIQYERCRECGKCTETCPTNALVFDSTWMNTEEVMQIVLRDRDFYRDSGGGVTLSGGDPVQQYRFSAELLEACRLEGIHTAVETCLAAEAEVIEGMLLLADTCIVDLKLFDAQAHRSAVGADNQHILENFRLLAACHKDILVRIPLIPGITACEQNLKQIVRYVDSVRPGTPVELINYNNLAASKYTAMGVSYPLPADLTPYTPQQMKDWYTIIGRDPL